MVFGILKARHVHVSRIARSLNESISMKKTWERLSRQLGRAGLAAETTEAHLRENRRTFRPAEYPAMDAEQAFETALEGCGCRRKIEEVHRQIKTDYHLESVQLQRYCALKNFNALFWMAMNFIYRDLDGLTVELIESCVEKLSYKPSIHDITGFCYYKLSRAVQLIFSRFRLNDLNRYYPPQSAARPGFHVNFWGRPCVEFTLDNLLPNLYIHTKFCK